jgi:hypothetical protein
MRWLVATASCSFVPLWLYDSTGAKAYGHHHRDGSGVTATAFEIFQYLGKRQVS